jgi:hypothetical protein
MASWEIEEKFYCEKRDIGVTTDNKVMPIDDFFGLINEKVKEVNRDFLYEYLDEESEKIIKEYKELLALFKQAKTSKKYICWFCEGNKKPKYIHTLCNFYHYQGDNQEKEKVDFVTKVNLKKLDIFVFMDLKKYDITMTINPIRWYCSDECMNIWVLQNIPLLP